MKIGDYVKCINNLHASEVLEINRIYRIRDVNEFANHTHIFLEELHSAWDGFDVRRFVKYNYRCEKLKRILK